MTTPLLRAGAGCGIAASVAGLMINAWHPRAPTDSLNDVAALAPVVADSDPWRLVHLATIATVVVGVAGVAAVLVSMMGERASAWPTVALFSLAVTTPLLLLSLGIDGFALKTLADRWAAAGPAAAKASALADLATVRELDQVVAALAMLLHFGVTTALIGLATWESPAYGRRLGAVALAAAATGMASGSLETLTGEVTVLSFLVLLTVSLVLFSAWLLAAAVRLWRRTGRYVALEP